MSRKRNSVRVWFKASETIGGNLAEWSTNQEHWADPIVLENQIAISAALDTTVKTLLYLGSPSPDIQINQNIDNQELIHTVMPTIHFAGRNVSRVEELDQPTRQNNIGFGI